LLRLVGITNPPLEVSHNWRQTLCAMVSRNFLEVDANVLYPRIDTGGDQAGIVGMEFPLFSYFCYLLSVPFGYRHWYGRIVNLLVSSIGTYYFFLLVRAQLKCRVVAFYSAMVLLFSLWFSFSRKVMPDTFSMSFVIASLYHGFRYLEPGEHSRRRHVWDGVLFGVFSAVGMLTKLPSGYLLSVLAIPFIRNRIDAKRRVAFAMVSALSLGTSLAWFFCWVPHLTEVYGVHHFFMGVDPSTGLRELMACLPLAMKRFYETAIKYIGFVVSLGGLGWVVAKRNRPLISLLACSFPAFMVIVIVSGYNFAHHTYYIIPYVPVMAVLAGTGLKAIKRPGIAIALLVAICLEGSIDQHRDFRIKPRVSELLLLEADLDACSGRESLIMVNGAGSPTPLYFAHRRGWSLSNQEIATYAEAGDLPKRGVECVIILNDVLGAKSVELNLPVSIRREAYTVYRLE